MTKFINIKTSIKSMGIIQGAKKVAVGISLLGLLGFSNNSFSQNIKKMIPGAEIGKIINKENNGFKVGIYVSNQKMQIGYIMEHNLKGKPSSLGVGMDLLKVGVEVDYFPINVEIIKPYIGSEITYVNESYFVGRENDITRLQNLIGDSGGSRVLVSGDVGVGKTTFVNYVRSMAPSNSFFTSLREIH